MAKRCMNKKRYLLWSLRNACEAINGLGFENKFGEPLSFSKFYRFISSKKQIVLQKDIPDTSCLCEVCENASLMARAVTKMKHGHPMNPHDMVERYTCEKTLSGVLQTNACYVHQKKSSNHGMLIRILIWILNPRETALMIILLFQRGEGKKEKSKRF